MFYKLTGLLLSNVGRVRCLLFSSVNANCCEVKEFEGKKNNLVFIEETITEYDEQISQFRTQNC